MEPDDLLAGWEPAEDVLAFVNAMGEPFSRDQLARLHKRDVIGRPRTRYLKGRRGQQTLYPPGTARAVRRIVELKRSRKKLDEIAWTLWWEGEVVGLRPVREYLESVAARFDRMVAYLRSELQAYRQAAPGSPERRNFERRFRTLDPPPGLGTVRKRLGKDSADYDAFLNLVFDVVLGERNFSDADADLVNHAVGFDEGMATPLQGQTGWLIGTSTQSMELMGELVSIAFVDRAARLSDEELFGARNLIKVMVDYVSSVGSMLHVAFKGPGLGFHTAGKFLTQGTATPAGQASMLLMFVGLLDDPAVRSGSLQVRQDAATWRDDGFHKFQAIQLLREEVPSFAKAVTAARLAAAMKSKQGEERLELVIRDFRARDDNARLLDAVIATRPDLFPKKDKEN